MSMLIHSLALTAAVLAVGYFALLLRGALVRQSRLAQLHGQPFIVPQAEFPVDEILRKTNIRVKVEHAFDNIEITKRAVEVGLGLALVPHITVVDEVRHGKLKALDLADGSVDRPIGLLTRKRAELSLPARKFIELLVAPLKARASHA